MIINTPALDIGKKGEWIVAENMVVMDKGTTIIIPEGFVTDLASIPRPIRWLIPINGKHRAAAIVHDFMYSVAGNTKDKQYTRKETDKLFKAHMGESGVLSWRKHLMYAAVRVAGSLHWEE